MKFPKIQKTGVQQIDDKLILSYNIPLMAHSNTCQLIFQKGSLHLSVQFLGKSRGRWELITTFLQILQDFQLEKFKPEKLTLRKDILDFSLLVRDFEEIKQIYQILEIIQDQTSRATSPVSDYLLERLAEDCGDGKKSYTKVISLAEQLIQDHKSGSINDKNHLGFILLQTLVEKKLVPYSDVIKSIQQFTQQNMTKQNMTYGVKNAAMKLASYLVYRGQAYEEGKNLALLFAQDKNWTIRLDSSDLIKLIEQKKGQASNQAKPGV
jgi:hypothetical protein